MTWPGIESPGSLTSTIHIKQLLVYGGTFLTTSHKYVLPGQCTIDSFEKEFSNLGQGFDDIYFMNV